MIVWGGQTQAGSVLPVTATGGIYDPVTDTWTATSTTNAPAARPYGTAVWTGSEMIVWGGGGITIPPGEYGGSYDPYRYIIRSQHDQCPLPAAVQHGSLDGIGIIIWGGLVGASGTKTGGVYDPATDTWTATSTANAPSTTYQLP